MPLLRDLLRQHRERRGLSQEELAALLEPPLSPDTISNVERGRTRPHRHTLENICQALCLDDDARQDVWAAWRATGSGMRFGGTRSSLSGGIACAPPTALIGREAELAVLHARLLQPRVRLLTLAGQGGVGKTRLALSLMECVAESFRDGTAFVDLSRLRNAGLVVPTIAHAFGIREPRGKPVLRALIEVIQRQNLLLVLDNFEHLLPAAADLAEVLAASHAVKMVATSREPLRLRWEHVYVVPALAVPDELHRASVDVIRNAPAVALFVDRAQAANESFVLTAANSVTVATLCSKLNGLPLALELAAARVRTLSPEALLDHIDHQLDSLKGARDAPARQQSLRATLDWSYDLLSETERQLFEAFSVFVGGCTLPAVESIGAALLDDSVTLSARANVVAQLEQLVDKSLVLREFDADGAARFFLLEPVRQYAYQRLEARGATEELHAMHAEFFLHLAECGEKDFWGSRIATQSRRLAAEQDNFRSALRWLIDYGHATEAQRLAAALSKFWLLWGVHTEGRLLLAEVLALKTAQPETRARLLNGIALLASFQSDVNAARVALDECLGLCRGQPASVELAHALFRRAELEWWHGAPLNARELANEGIHVSRRVRHTALEAACQWVLGGLAFDAGNYIDARRSAEQALRSSQAAGDTLGIGMTTGLLGRVSHVEGDITAANTWLDQSLAAFRSLDFPYGTALTLKALGWVALDRGDLGSARALLEESLRIAHRIGAEPRALESLEGLGWLAMLSGQPERAVRIAAAVTALRETANVAPSPMEAARLATWSMQARRQLGPNRAAQEWAVGRVMSLADTLAEALTHSSCTLEDR